MCPPYRAASMSFMTLAKAYLKHFLLILPAIITSASLFGIITTLMVNEGLKDAITLFFGILYFVVKAVAPTILLLSLPLLVYFDKVKKRLNTTTIYIIAMISGLLAPLLHDPLYMDFYISLLALPLSYSAALISAIIYIKTLKRFATDTIHIKK